MTTQVVVDGTFAKRKPTAEEWEILLENRIPELIRRYKGAALDPAAVNSTLQQVLEGMVITESKTVATTPPKPKVDSRFELVKTFKVVVPEGYDHATRLDTFKVKYQNDEVKSFGYYNPELTDANYAAKATTKLVAGRRFTVKVFQIKRRVSSLGCLKHLRAEKAVLVGTQGASLAWEEKRDELPVNRWSISFDEKDALWEDSDGCHRVPCVRRYSGGSFKFSLGGFEIDWNDGDCLLCFCDEEPSDTVATE